MAKVKRERCATDFYQKSISYNIRTKYYRNWRNARWVGLFQFVFRSISAERLPLGAVKHHQLSTDILIIGAGPAGATTSLFLAKMGIPHLIIDAANFPRDKVCGDGLDLKVMRVLHHLDPAIVPHEMLENPHFVSSWGTRFWMQNGRAVDFVYEPSPNHQPPYPLFCCAKRFYFDDFLVKKLDPRFADFRPGVRAEKIERDGKGWRVFTAGSTASSGEEASLEIRARLLIGADGDRSVLLRALGERKIDRWHYAGTLRQYWSGVEDLHPKNLIEVYFPKGLPMSYCYIFPLPNGEANVGYGMVSEIAAQGRHNLRDIFKRLLTEDPVMAPRFRHAEALEAPVGWGLPLASRRRPAAGEGYLLVGDAASLVCPTSGEGIGTGMMSGYIAAQFVQNALKSKDFSREQFRHYDREIHRRLQDEIRLYQLMMRLSPRAYDFGLNLLAPSPLFQWMFRRGAKQWIQTAYETPIQVTM